jgi:uracil-DNA glycosylase
MPVHFGNSMSTRGDRPQALMAGIRQISGRRQAFAHGRSAARFPVGKQPLRKDQMAHEAGTDRKTGAIMGAGLVPLADHIRGCRLCEPRFAATATAHAPRPVVWFAPDARVLIAGQAPGTRVHASGRPFTDPSGDRLRGWLGLDEATFYDRTRIAIVPMAFCFPGQDAKGADLPPPLLCAATWRRQVMAALPRVRLTVLLGGAAIRWHLGPGRVMDHVAAWARHAPALWPLPHPSWRTSAWRARAPWIDDDLLPALRADLRKVLDDATDHPA